MPLYFMPTATNSSGRAIAKYDQQLAPFGAWAIRFGNNPHCLVYSACDAATDTAVTANADVRRLPDDLDVNLTQGQVNSIQTFLENNNIPAGWVSTSLTWRQVVRGVLQIFMFVQRYQGVGGSPVFTTGVTLDSTFSSLPLAVRQKLQQAATDQSFDTSSLTGASTLRQILRTMGQQWGARELLLGTLSI